MSETSTPRTDAAEFVINTTGNPEHGQWVVDAEDCRELERELQTASMVQHSVIIQDTHELVRYGIRWNGPREPIADSTLPGGYWTPWHIAQAEISRLTAALQSARGDAKTAVRSLLVAGSVCEAICQRIDSALSTAPPTDAKEK